MPIHWITGDGMPNVQPDLKLNRFAVPVALLSTAFFAATMLLAKVIGATGMSPFQISAGRFQFALMTLLIYSAIRPAEFPTFKDVPWVLHIARSCCGWLGVTCMFAAAVWMPLGEATAISFLNPLIAMVLAAVVLKEGFTFSKYSAGIMGLIGASLILRPGMEAFQPAAIFALGAATFLGIEAVLIKQLSDREPILRILLINNMIGTLIASTVALFFWQAPTPDIWALLVLLGVIMVSGQALFTRGMKWGEASQIAPILYAVLAFAALYDFLYFGEIPVFWSILGAALIVISALLLSFGGKSSDPKAVAQRKP
ncbi:MAG: DMT family transporter [Pseudomonadota bacterium]